MNETLALTQYAWTRYRFFLSILIPVSILSVTLTIVLKITEAPQWLSGTVGGIGYLAVLFALTGTIVLFGFSRQTSLLDPKSGYDGWLMRLPISNWKLATIPVGLMTCWILTIWTGTAIVVRLVGGPCVPIISQSLGMSSCAIIACSLGWMPFRTAWPRIVLTIVALPLLYFVGWGAVVVFFQSPEWMSWAIAGIVAFYIASIILAYYSVKLARVASFQQVDANVKTLAHKPTSPAISRSFVCWPDALNWYDSKRTRGTTLLHILAMSTLIAILISIMEISAAGAIFTMVIFAAIVGWVVSTRFEPTVWGARSGLPSYLIASPLPSRAMAFTRLRSYATEYIGLMLIMTLIWLSCFVWQSNREAVSQWWSSVTAAGVSPMAPLRTIAAIYLAILVTMLGSSLRCVCVQLRGRQAIVVWLLAACCVMFIGPLIGFLTWFILQRDWEHVDRAAEDWLRWSHQLLYIAIVAKLVFNAIVVGLASRSMFAWREIITAIMGWCAWVVAGAVAWYALWPLGHVQFLTVLMATSLAIPLSVYFAGPLAVRANRHHRVTG